MADPDRTVLTESDITRNGALKDALAPAASAQAAAEAAQTSAVDAATSAEASATLAQQAQAAALEVPDANTAAMIGNPATDTATALAGFSRTRETHVVPADHGVTGDGSTNDSAALTAAANAASSSRRTLTLPSSYRLGTNMALSTDHLVIDGQGTGELRIDADNGLRIEPPRTTAGSTQGSTPVGATTVTVSGAAWTTNEHVGKWVIIADPAINPISQDGTVHSRRITANTSDTLTVDEPIGYPIPAGCAVDLATPLTSVTLRGITLRRTTPGGHDLRISYVNEVILDDVTSIDAGTMGTQRGNAISIYHSPRVRVTDCAITRPANFGLFVYHCNDTKIDRTTVEGSGGQFSFQLKDCRYSIISRCLSKDARDAAYNLKCSGLNIASDLTVVDSVATGSAVNGIELSSITNEGALQGERFSVVDTAVSDLRGTGVATITDSGTGAAATASWSLIRVDVRRAGLTAYSLTAPGVSLVDSSASMCGFEAALVTANDVKIAGGEFRDNCQRYVSGEARSSETRSDGARLSITGTTFVRTTAGKAIRAHRDTAAAARTLLRDTAIRDTAPAYAQDYLLSTTSKAVGLATLDVLGGSTTVNKVPPSAT